MKPGKKVFALEAEVEEQVLDNSKKKKIQNTQTSRIKRDKPSKKNESLSHISENKDGEDQSHSSISAAAVDPKRASRIKLLISSLLNKREALKYDNLNSLQEWGYSVGHFMNDLTAACWFNYLLYWFKEVLLFQYASYAMLSGQIFDAISTPLVGYFSDKYTTRFGKRKPWYVGGTLLVLIGFLPVFHCFIPGQIWASTIDSEGLKAFYYIFFPSLFNVGWASVQISHMSLVPSLTVSRTKRDHLNNRRNTFTFVANLAVLCIALILFQTIQDSLTDFEILGCIVIGIGSITSAIFIISINETKLTKDCEKQTGIIREILASNSSKEDKGEIVSSPNSAITTWKEWMKERQFYHYAFVYMGCRLYCNVVSTMLNFFMVYVLQIATKEEIANKTPIEIALIPLLLFISSVIMSSSLDTCYEKIGKRRTFSIGGVFMIITSVSLAFIEPDTGYLMYPIAVLIGCTQVLMLNTAITLISDVIGLRGESGAFVFGAYSFMDKISTGIALFSISESSLFTSASFIRWTTVLVPFCAAVLAWILILTGSIQDSYSLYQSSPSSSSRFSSEEDLEKKGKQSKRLGINREGNESSDESSSSLFAEQEKKMHQQAIRHLIKDIKKEFAN